MNNDEYRSIMQIVFSCNGSTSKNCEQMFIFIEGGAGVGKTLLGRALCETITRFHRKQVGTADNNEHILILAPTGMAVYHIKGTTFHTGLCILPQQLGKLTPLTNDQQNSLRARLINVSHIFIDEVSMVGSTLSEYGNTRLQEIFDCKKPFGGKHVIAIGDFYQMKPVMDGYIFKNSGKCYTALAPNVWCDNFKIYSLTEILRQKQEKKFCQILNCLRKAQCTEEDNRIFESCIVKKDSQDYNFGARHIFPFANAAEQHNRNIFHQMQGDKVTIQAEDAVYGNPNEGEWDMACYRLMVRDEYDKINGLLRSLDAAVGAVYIVSCNLSTVDGLINGAVCTIKHIDYRNSKNGIIPSILWVQFEDVNRLDNFTIKNTNTIMVMEFLIHGHPYLHSTEKQLYNCRAIRAQFPLIPTAAVTIHKCREAHFKMLLLTYYAVLHTMLFSILC